MQWVGFFASLVIWALLASGSLWGALFLYREKVLSDKWLLLVPYLFASLLYYGVRYRFPQWFFTLEGIHQFFGPGAYWEADRIIFIICIPLFYAISVLKPEWVVRFWVNVPLLVLLPFVLKLFLYLSGIAGWNEHPATMQPSRVE